VKEGFFEEGRCRYKSIIKLSAKDVNVDVNVDISVGEGVKLWIFGLFSKLLGGSVSSDIDEVLILLVFNKDTGKKRDFRVSTGYRSIILRKHQDLISIFLIRQRASHGTAVQTSTVREAGTALYHGQKTRTALYGTTVLRFLYCTLRTQGESLLLDILGSCVDGINQQGRGSGKSSLSPTLDVRDEVCQKAASQMDDWVRGQTWMLLDLDCTGNRNIGFGTVDFARLLVSVCRMFLPQ
jgi:hypothetical protein